MKKTLRQWLSSFKEEAIAAAPTNVVGSGAIAGTGGLGGEPGVSKRKKFVMGKLHRRKSPRM